MPSLLAQVACLRRDDSGRHVCGCSNARVTVSFACTGICWLLLLVYALPLFYDRRRLEQYVPATCSLLTYSTPSYQCTQQRCSAGGGPCVAPCTACSSAIATCYACQFTTLLSTAQGASLLAYSDFMGTYGSMADAVTACTRTLTPPGATPDNASQAFRGVEVQCWYVPDQPRDNRFYASLQLPAPSVSPAPVVVFALFFTLSLCCMCAWYCASADPVRERRDALAAAQAREMERILQRDMRTQRWTDYYTSNNEVDPMARVMAATRQRREREVAQQQQQRGGVRAGVEMVPLRQVARTPRQEMQMAREMTTMTQNPVAARRYASHPQM